MSEPKSTGAADRSRAIAAVRAGQGRAKEPNTPRGSSAPIPRGSPLPPPGDPNALYVLDMSGYVFRAYHAVAPLSNSKGEPTHAVLGATQMLKRLIDNRKPKYFAVAMDSGKPSFRKELDVRYKATRPEPPSDLASQIVRCEQIARAYGIPIYRQDSLEADDLIASLVAKVGREQPNITVIVVSADKDLMQLVRDGDLAQPGRVLVWDTMRDKVYGPPEVQEKFAVPAHQLRDLLALMGDSSDNVPGVPSVGPKTGADLLARFPTIEALYAAIEQGPVEGIKPRLRDVLIANKADALISQQLVTLKTDLSLELNLTKLEWHEPTGQDALPLRNLYIELEFGRLAETIVVADTIHRTTRAIANVEQLEQVVQQITEARQKDPQLELALDTESTSLHPTGAILVGISLCFRPGEGLYLPLSHHYLGMPKTVTLAEARAILGPVLADPNVRKIGHNLKFDIEMLRLAGLPVHGVAFDSLLAHYLLDPDAPHGLKDLASQELGVTMASYDEITRRNAERRGSQLGFDEVPIEEAATYAGADADVSHSLAVRLAPRCQEAAVLDLLRDVELPVMEVLADMELSGILVDVDVLRKLTREVDEQLQGIEQRARVIVTEVLGEGAARDFNLASPKQLENMLFDVLKLRVVKRTKTGRSTDAEVLEELAEEHPIAGVVLEHRSLSKLKGTYLEALPRLVSPKTGRIHTTYQQHVAATGRISSTDPNLQNIPIRTELGMKIRGAFRAPPGFVLLSADYSQIELRVLADLSKDAIMVDSFTRGEDVHERTARELFLPPGSTESPTKEMRRRGKTVNFGVVYGQGEAALSKQLNIPRAEAAGFIERYFERYSGVRQYLDEMVVTARRGDAVRTLLGRRRFLADIHSANRMLRAQAERIARNTPIQGTAADILKLAMIALAKPVVPGARMLLTVHDELVFEVPEDRVAEAAEIVREKMANVVKLSVPLVVDVGWGKTWAEAH